MAPNCLSTVCTSGLVLLLLLSVRAVHAQTPIEMMEVQPTAAAPKPGSPPLAAVPSAEAPAESHWDESAKHDPYERKSGLLIGGVITYVASYAVTAAAGMFGHALSAESCSEGYSRQACTDSRLMLIPVVGPWMAYETFGGLSALFGVAQALGVVLTIAGASKYANSGKVRSYVFAEPSGDRFSLAAAPLAGGGFMSARLLL